MRRNCNLYLKMKKFRFTVVFLIIISTLIVGCYRPQKVTQKKLRTSVLLFKEKFTNAEEIKVFMHNHISAGEEFKEVRNYTLSSDQVEKLCSRIDLVSRSKLSYREPMPMVVQYDITIAVKSSNDMELITIDGDKRKITAHNNNPHPTPPELAMTLHDFFSSQ
jgi:hypothetical protein